MIRASALLVALAIGLLVAGVVASSLLMVYVSIGVCAVAALILAVGVLSHWSEIFGRGESRPASVPESWSAPQVQVSAPVLASAQGAATAGRESRRSRREDSGGRPAASPVEVLAPQGGPPAAGRSDDLWERVEEELGSPAKRDTGALSWPGIELPAPAVTPEPPEETAPPGRPARPETAGASGGPPAGTKAWIWGSGAGWQPPDTPDPAAWPPPAAAFAEAPARPGPATPEVRTPATEGRDAEPPGPAGQEAARSEPAAVAAGRIRPAGEAAPGAADDEPGGPVPETAPVEADDRPGRPQWIITLPGGQAGPASPSRPSSAEPGTGESAAEPAADEPSADEPSVEEPAAEGPAVEGPAAEEPAAEEPAAEGPAAEGPAAEGPAVEGPAAEGPAAEGPAAEGPAVEGPAAEGPAAEEPAVQPAPGRVDVTVVPGVARYHRSECILIRFLGAGDLEIMTRQEAEEAAFVPCRACQPDLLEG